MKTLIALLSLLMPASLAELSTQDIASVKSPHWNNLINPSFEYGRVRGITDSAAIGSINSDSNYIRTGKASLLVDSASAGQKVIFTPVDGNGDDAYADQQRFEFSCFTLVPSGTSTYRLGVSFDGGTTLRTSQPINTPTTWKKVMVEFDMPAAGSDNVKGYLYSVASNEPVIYLDDCYFGPAHAKKKGQDPPREYVKIGDGEAGLGDIALYADAAGTAPVDGTAGSANLTIDTTETTPIEGRYSFSLVKDASDRQGQGLSIPFTLDSAYPRVLQIDFDYLVSSGTFVAGTDSTSSDVTVWVYDVTNSALISGPSTQKLFCASSTACHFTSNFQTSATGTSYRLILHVGSTSASAYTLKLDNIRVSTSRYVYGTPITDWSSYTPTFTGFGTVSTYQFWQRRVGDTLQVRGTFTAGTATATEARISIPYTSSDSTKIDTLELCGKWNNPTQSASFFSAGTVLCERSVAYVTFGAETSTLDGVTKQNGNAFAASSDTFKLFFQVPIAGWSSNVQTSDQADARNVSARYYAASPTTVSGSFTGANLVIGYGTIEHDTHAAYNTSTGVYTIPVSGKYCASASYRISFTSFAAGDYARIKVFKNGVTTGMSDGLLSFHGTVTFGTPTVSFCFDAKAGDAITVLGDSNRAGAFASDAPLNYFSIFRQSQASLMSATETVAISYGLTSAQAVSTNAVIKYDTKVVDTHNAYSTSTGLFTAPVSGVYEIAAGHNMSASGGSYIKKNGTAVAYVGTAGANTFIAGSYLVSLLAGDTIGIYCDNAGTYAATSANGYVNRITIHRVGL